MAPTTKSDASFVVKTTIKGETFDIDVSKLTGVERRDAKRLLEVEQFSIEQLVSDDVGFYVLAYLAARKRRPTLTFEQVLEVPGDELTIDFGEVGAADPFEPSAPPASKAKSSSPKASAAA